MPHAKHSKVSWFLIREVVQRALVRTLWKVAERIKGCLARDLRTRSISLGERRIFCKEALQNRNVRTSLGCKKALIGTDNNFWTLGERWEGEEGEKKSLLTEEITLDRFRDPPHTKPLEAWKRLTAKGGESQKRGEKLPALTESIGKSGSIKESASKKSYQKRQLETVDHAARIAAAEDKTFKEENW